MIYLKTFEEFGWFDPEERAERKRIREEKRRDLEQVVLGDLEKYREKRRNRRDNVSDLVDLLMKKLKEGDKITYVNPKSDHNGETATFVSMRDDGKYRICFDDGDLLDADQHHVRPYDKETEKNIKLDPYGEEEWKD